jgi:hypothetical protein
MILHQLRCSSVNSFPASSLQKLISESASFISIWHEAEQFMKHANALCLSSFLSPALIHRSRSIEPSVDTRLAARELSHQESPSSLSPLAR